jgi:hypothetical protein
MASVALTPVGMVRVHGGENAGKAGAWPDTPEGPSGSSASAPVSAAAPRARR